MNLLLDTHLLLWAAFRPDRLSPEGAAMIADPGVLRAGLLANDYAELPVAGRHCLGLSGLPRLHADPFDRILIAQALAQGMMLLTTDARVAAYPGPIRAV